MWVVLGNSPSAVDEGLAESSVVGLVCIFVPQMPLARMGRHVTGILDRPDRRSVLRVVEVEVAREDEVVVPELAAVLLLIVLPVAVHLGALKGVAWGVTAYWFIHVLIALPFKLIG